jgi:hypothetical protein
MKLRTGRSARKICEESTPYPRQRGTNGVICENLRVYLRKSARKNCGKKREMGSSILPNPTIQSTCYSPINTITNLNYIPELIRYYEKRFNLTVPAGVLIICPGLVYIITRIVWMG